MAFAQKTLRLTFTLWQGTFAGTGDGTLQVSGLRTQVRVTKAQAPVGSKLSLAVYGLTLSQMNDLSTLGITLFSQAVTPNSITVEADGGDGSGFSTVFVGNIYNAYADLQGMPDVPFRVDATSIGLVNVLPADPGSVSGNVVPVLQSLAGRANLDFESNGVNATVRNLYLWGSVNDQIKEICHAVGIGCAIDDGKLIIWPKGASRAATIPVVSPSTGLVSFPSFYDAGLILKTAYNPSITFLGKIEVRSRLLSSITPARLAAVQLPSDGIYMVSEIDHDLESWVPNGTWFSNIYATSQVINSMIQQGALPG